MRDIVLARIRKLYDRITPKEVNQAMRDKSMVLVKEIADKILRNSIIAQVENEIKYAFNNK